MLNWLRKMLGWREEVPYVPSPAPLTVYAPTPKPKPEKPPAPKPSVVPTRPAVEILVKLRPWRVWWNGMRETRVKHGGWWSWKLADDVYMSETDDDMIVNVMSFFVGGIEVMRIKDKHSQLWTLIRDGKPDTSEHPNRLTFGVFGYAPLETQEHFDALAPEYQRLLNLLAAALERHDTEGLLNKPRRN